MRRAGRAWQVNAILDVMVKTPVNGKRTTSETVRGLDIQPGTPIERGRPGLASAQSHPEAWPRPLAVLPRADSLALRTGLSARPDPDGLQPGAEGQSGGSRAHDPRGGRPGHCRILTTRTSSDPRQTGSDRRTKLVAIEDPSAFRCPKAFRGSPENSRTWIVLIRDRASIRGSKRGQP